MSLNNRPYWRDGGDGNDAAGGRVLRPGLPRPTRGVVALMIACFALFLTGTFSRAAEGSLMGAMALLSDRMAQVWRLVTFQFLHGGAQHIMWNMVGLYFFGPPLERLWGTRRFLVFYLGCGVFSGLCFWAMSLIWPFIGLTLVGASGGIMAALMACAILFPEIYFLIVPIRWAAGFYAVLYILSILHDRDYADAAHLGGMVAAALWLLAAPALARAFPRRERAPGSSNSGAWKRRMQKLADEQARVDEVLKKIHDHGIASLTHREKKILQDATRRQREEERQINRR